MFKPYDVLQTVGPKPILEADYYSCRAKQLTAAKILHGKLGPDLREEITNALKTGARGM